MPAQNATVTMSDTIEQVLRTYQLTRMEKPIVVAVSGGADSMALLYGFAQLQKSIGLRLHVAHLDHALRPQSVDDARFVSTAAQEFGIPITVERDDVASYADARGLSLEEGARECRYAFLARTAMAIGTDTVTLGHTADDQAETVLLHLVRGSGLRGLRGMDALTSLLEPTTGRALWLLRPLLKLGREVTQEVCRAAGIQPREDPSNLSLRFTRNRLRHEVLPLLREINPAVRDALTRLASTAGQDDAFLQQEVAQYPEAVRRREQNALYLDREVLQSMHQVLQRRLLQMAYQELAGPSQSLDQAHVNSMLHLMQGRPGGRVDLPGGVVFSMGYGECILGPDPEQLCPLPELTEEYAIAVPGVTQVGHWQVEAQVTEGMLDREFADGVSQAVLDLAAVGVPLKVRTRRSGDRFQPIGMEGAKKLQDFFVDEKVPRAWRDRVPLVMSSRGVAWVVGYRIAHWARVTGQTSKVVELIFTQMEKPGD